MRTKLTVIAGCDGGFCCENKTMWNLTSS